MTRRGWGLLLAGAVSVIGWAAVYGAVQLVRAVLS